MKTEGSKFLNMLALKRGSNKANHNVKSRNSGADLVLGWASLNTSARVQVQDLFLRGNLHVSGHRQY